MKTNKRTLLIIGMLAALVFASSCVITDLLPKKAANQLTEGLVQLILMPLKEATDNEYVDGIRGEVAKLTEERSFTSETTVSIEDINMEYDYSGMTDMLNGAELDVDTMYDAKSGDTAVEINGLGLVNMNFYLQGAELAVDLPGLAEGIIVSEFDSQLDFKGTTSFQDRIADFQETFGKQLSSSSVNQDMVDELESILLRYAAELALNIEKDQIEIGKDEVTIMGKDQTVRTLTITLNEDDLIKFAGVLLEKAEDDEELKEFVINNILMYNAEDYRDAEDMYEDALDEALDSLDYASDDPEPVDMVLTLAFLKSKPVAIFLNVEDHYTEADIFYKYFSDGREKDLEVSIDSDGEKLEGFLLNEKNGSTYELTAELDLPDDQGGFELDGSVDVSKRSETADYSISIDTGDMGLSSHITQVLSAVKPGSEYETTSEVSVSVDSYGETVGVELSSESSLIFSRSLDVELPDWAEDRDTIYVDSLEELADEIENAFYNFNFDF